MRDGANVAQRRRKASTTGNKSPGSRWRRVALLYGTGELFACRHCYGLTYASQREALYFRDLGKAQKIRMRLGGSPVVSEAFPDKPKGMHWQTYDLGAAAAWPLAVRAQQPMLPVIGFLHSESPGRYTSPILRVPPGPE